MADLTFEQVSCLLSADFESGRLFWLPRTADICGSAGRSSARVSSWNAQHAGKEAFTSDDGEGYRVGAIFGKRYSAHRVLWLLKTGEWPRGEIDHINGNPADNRISNLRDVTHADNGKNVRRQGRSASGVCGVFWNKRSRKWQAHIRVKGKSEHLGFFTEFDRAIAARKRAEMLHGFHPNHGRVAVPA